MATTDTPTRGADRSARRLIILPLLLLPGLLLSPRTASGAAGVRLVVDGRTVTVESAGRTVREVLEEANVVLADTDEVSPGLDATPAQGATIRVKRVTFTEGTVEVKVPYATVIRPATPGNRPYHPTVIRDGRSGLKRVTYRARVEDGREVSRATTGETLIREPVAQVVVARKPQSLGSRGAYAGKRTITVLATAYDPGAGSCGRYADGKTCNGRRAGYGIIAVDPRVIPLGAKLHVPGYGYGIAADVGSAIKGNHVDLGFNSRSGALQWGKKYVRLTIVD